MRSEGSRPFGPEETHPERSLLRTIDPTVGSEHFLLGGFERLLAHWQKQEPMTEPAVLAERCLSSLFGVDLNPYAANIARFQLLAAALKACGIKRLREARDWKINIAVGDSLLHGRSRVARRAGNSLRPRSASTAAARTPPVRRIWRRFGGS